MPVIDCTTGEKREHTAEELAAIEAERIAAANRPKVERDDFGDLTPRDFVLALLDGFVREGVITGPKAQAIGVRVRDSLKR